MIFSMMIVLRKPFFFFFFTNTARKPVEVLSMSTDLSGKKKKSIAVECLSFYNI